MYETSRRLLTGTAWRKLCNFNIHYLPFLILCQMSHASRTITSTTLVTPCSFNWTQHFAHRYTTRSITIEVAKNSIALSILRLRRLFTPAHKQLTNSAVDKIAGMTPKAARLGLPQENILEVALNLESIGHRHKPIFPSCRQNLLQKRWQQCSP